MTNEELKAWLEGFSEAIDKTPTEKQWKKIKEKISQLDGSKVTERIFIDRYNHYDWWRLYSSTNAVGYNLSNSGATVHAANVPHEFCSESAMYQLGKYEGAI